MIKGEPGTGKTLLAEEVAKSIDTEIIKWHIKSTTKAQQGLYEYDAVTRLRDSQLGDERVKDIKNYIKKEAKIWEKIRVKILVDIGKILLVPYRHLIRIGAAIECIHAYSLIHDDLPCMDDDDLRRGKLTVHKKYGESTAVLAGNSLLTMAFEIISEKTFLISDIKKNQLVYILAASSGHTGIAGGQFQDLSFERKKVVVVSHGALIKSLLCYAEGKPLAELWTSPRMHNCAHSIILYNGQAPDQIIQYADLPYTELAR